MGAAPRAARSGSCAPRIPRGHLKRGRGERGAGEGRRSGGPSWEKGERRAGPGTDLFPLKGEGRDVCARPEGRALPLTGAGVISRPGCFKREPPGKATARAGWLLIRQPRGHSPKPAATVLLGFGSRTCCSMRASPLRASVSLRWDDGDVGATTSHCSSRWAIPCSGHITAPADALSGGLYLGAD